MAELPGDITELVADKDGNISLELSFAGDEFGDEPVRTSFAAHVVADSKTRHGVRIASFEAMPQEDPAETAFDTLCGTYNTRKMLGDWFGEIELESDGSMHGYERLRMAWDTGDGFPNGTIGYGEYDAKLAVPEAAGEHIWRTRVEALSVLEHESIILQEGWRFVDWEGGDYFNAGDEILFYEPGAALPEVDEFVRLELERYVDLSNGTVPEGERLLYNASTDHFFLLVN